MKTAKALIAIIIGLSFNTLLFAGTGMLFKVSSSGSQLSLTTTIPNHSYKHAGIKITTPGYSIANCVLSKSGYCLFQSSDKTPALISINGKPGTLHVILCLNGITGLSCQEYEGASNYTGTLYVSDVAENKIFKCSLFSNGKINQCNETANTGIAIQVPLGIAFNKSRTMSYIVLADSNEVLRCPVNATGNLGACIDSGNGANQFVHPITITLNKSSTKAYITNQVSAKISICPIKTNGSFGICQTYPSQGTSPFDSPVGTALDPTEKYLYVTNQGTTNNIIKCVVKTNGSLQNCKNANLSGFLFTKPDNLVINKSNTIAYITDSGVQKIYQCQINGQGNFNGCKDTGNSLANIAADILLNKAENLAYVGNGDGGVVQCPIGSSGNLGICSLSGKTGFQFPLYLALLEPINDW